MDFCAEVSSDGFDELVAYLPMEQRFEFTEPCKTRIIIVDRIILRLDRGIFTLKGHVVSASQRKHVGFWYDKSFVDSLLPDSIAMIVASEFMHYELQSVPTA